MKINRFLFAATAVLCCACSPKVMHSLDKEVEALVSDQGGRLTYSVRFHGTEVIAPSEMGLVLDGDTLGREASVKLAGKRRLNEDYPTRGIHSVGRNHSAHDCIILIDFHDDSFLTHELQLRIKIHLLLS